MFAQVALLRNMPRRVSVLDYRIAAGQRVLPGSLVSVPLRGRSVLGIVIDTSSRSAVPARSISPIEHTFFDTALVPPYQLRVAQMLSNQFACPLFRALLPMLPPLQPRKLASAHVAPLPVRTRITAAKIDYVWYQSSSQKKDWFKKHIQAQSGGILIAVPEKWHEREWENIIRDVMPNAACIFTGKLTSPKERFTAYFSLRNNKIRIVVGTKSALFLPFPALRRIIVDFEHNPHHKNWDQSPRYDARAVATMLSQTTGAPLTFMSHTPSVEAVTGLIIGARPTSLAGGIDVADLSEVARAGTRAILTDACQEAVEQNLRRGNDLVFLVKRPGASTTVVCKVCGATERCAICDLPLALWRDAKNRDHLRCGPCGTLSEFTARCYHCGGTSLLAAGMGSQRLTDEVRRLIGDRAVQIVRIDGDSAGAGLDTNTPAVLTGTVRVLAHVRWGRVGLFIITDADGFLAGAEYRATFDFIGILRDIRYHLSPQAQLIVQTRQPHHPVISTLHSGNLLPYYRNEAAMRRHLHYPPFWSILKLTYAGTTRSEGTEASRMMSKIKKTLGGAQIDGPFAGGHGVRGRTGEIILVRLPRAQARVAFGELLQTLNLSAEWKIDINPYQLLR